MITLANWDDFLEIAKFFRDKNYFQGEFKNKSLEDALKRNVVGRAYYAAFNKTVEFALAELGFKINPQEKEKTHTEVRKHLANLAVGLFKKNENILGNILKEIEGNLDSLRQYRNSCDYDKRMYINPDKLANDSIKFADRVFELLKLLKVELIKFKAKKGI